MTEPEMIERVARAIWSQRRTACAKVWALPSWEDDLDGLREEVRAEARAAIEAMRVPTEAMIAAVETTERGKFEYTPCAESWPIMVDAALK